MLSTANIYHYANYCNAIEMNIDDIRLKNLLLLKKGRPWRVCAELWNTSASTLSQIVSANGHRNLGKDLARKIELAENVPVGWMDLERDKHPEEDIRHSGLSTQESTEKTGPDENGSPSKKDYALIPQYTAKAAAGSGYHNDHVELTAGLAFKRDWLRRTGSKPENLCVIYAEGSSMEPTISDGEVLLIDRTERTPRNGKVFALLRPDGSVSIKRLIQSFSGDWLIRSDNPDKTNYPDEPISPEDLQHVEIIGRSVWRGGGM